MFCATCAGYTSFPVCLPVTEIDSPQTSPPPWPKKSLVRVPVPAGETGCAATAARRLGWDPVIPEEEGDRPPPAHHHGGGAMIQTVLRREFHVACDGCGHTTTPQATADQAYEWAFDHDWQPITSLCGF